jgi:hypothetical protein
VFVNEEEEEQKALEEKEAEDKSEEVETEDKKVLTPG